LTKDTRPDGSWQTFSRNGKLAPTSVTRGTALGRTETFAVSKSATGDSEARNDVDAAGLQTLKARNADHTGSVTLPGGTAITTMDYDALGRLTQVSPPGVYPTQLHYDARGRNDSITRGTRVTNLAYRSDGFFDNILDPLLHRTSFGYDLAGRPTSQTLPDVS